MVIDTHVSERVKVLLVFYFSITALYWDWGLYIFYNSSSDRFVLMHLYTGT